MGTVIGVVGGQAVHHRESLACNEIQVGTEWVPADGASRVVTVSGVDLDRGMVAYVDRGTRVEFERDGVAFQTRYCQVFARQ